MKILYFAWLRERIGRGEETIELPATVQTVGDLMAHLKTLGPEYENALADTSAIRAAIDQTHADQAAPIADAREIALFSADDRRLNPAMTTSPTIRVQAEAFDLGAEIEALKHRVGSTDIGAITTFTGICRSDGGALTALELEHYPGMADAELARIAGIAAERWPVQGITLIHRFGKIPVGEDIVLVVTASPHRQASFDAASFLMDYLKTNAPFWKKEHFADGRSGDWVAAKASDDEAALKWDGR